jgi:hypothetical protein
MNRRQRVEAVFAGQASDLPPVSIRLDLWHKDAVATGRLPDEVAGMSFEQVEDYLGFPRAARFRCQVKLVFPSCETVQTKKGDTTMREYRFPGRVLTHCHGRTAEMERQGMQAHTTAYPLRGREDYVTLLENIGGAKMEFASATFADFDAATGDTGLPMLIVGACPAHTIMLAWAGYEQFYYHLADFPDVVNKLIDEFDRIYRRDLWPYVTSSGAALVLHGAHFNTPMNPPPIFRQYFLPYFREFNAMAHRAGMKVVFHADADCFGLLEDIVEAGFDGADCLATAPLVPHPLEDYLKVWKIGRAHV